MKRSDGDCKFIRNSILNNQILGIFLIFAYCLIYGITAQVVLAGLQMMFFLSSLIFALSIFYIRDPDIQKVKIRKGILYSQIVGTCLVFAYLLVYGVTSIALLSGFQLVFFMSSYIFAMSVFYIRDPERIQKSENISVSITNASSAEKYPCFINNNDMSWLVRELNNSLATVVGFSELMLKKQYSEHEKEYMIRNIYEQAISMSGAIDKVSETIPDSPTKPKHLHELYKLEDLLDDKNFVNKEE